MKRNVDYLNATINKLLDQDKTFNECRRTLEIAFPEFTTYELKEAYRKNRDAWVLPKYDVDSLEKLKKEETEYRVKMRMIKKYERQGEEADFFFVITSDKIITCHSIGDIMRKTGLKRGVLNRCLRPYNQEKGNNKSGEYEIVHTTIQELKKRFKDYQFDTCL